MADVYLLGVGTTPSGTHSETSYSGLSWLAARHAIEAGSIDITDLDVTFSANTAQGRVEGQYGVNGEHALRPMGVNGFALFNIGSAFTSPGATLNLTCLQVAAGQADIALADGSEKINITDRERNFSMSSVQFRGPSVTAAILTKRRELTGSCAGETTDAPPRAPVTQSRPPGAYP